MAAKVQTASYVITLTAMSMAAGHVCAQDVDGQVPPPEQEEPTQEAVPRSSLNSPIQDGTLSIPRTFRDETQQPSPESSRMNRYIDYPVDCSTGTANVSIPLYELSAGSYRLPLTLSYHTSGIRVDDEDCLVGLGWSFHSGGCITRTVHGLPDEYRGFELKTANSIGFNEDIDYLKDVLHRHKDAQYDRYYYHLPGYSGSFILRDGIVFQLPKSDVRIKLIGTVTDGVRDFKITTPDGCIYYFTSREHTQYTYLPAELTPIAGYLSPNYTAVTGWHLTSIVTPSRTDTIRFTYATAPHTRTVVSDRLRSSSFTITGNQPAQGGFNDPNMLSESRLVYPDRLVPAGISCRTATVTFSLVPESSSVAYAHLTGFTVSTPSGTAVRQVTFSSSEYPNGEGRRCLDGVTVTSGGTLLDSRTFTYYSGNGSRNRDLFGYNNSSTGNSTRIYNSVLDAVGTLSGDRSYRFDSARGFALHTVTEATGAVTTYEYEANHCPYESSCLLQDEVSIGLRLKKITVHDPLTGSDRIRQFQYGQARSTIDFSLINEDGFISVSGMRKHGGLGSLASSYSTGAAFTSSCRIPGMQAENAVIYYGQVTELVSGTGLSHPLKTVYEYDLTDIEHPYVELGTNILPDIILTSNNERYLGTKIYNPTLNNNALVFSGHFLHGYYCETVWEKAPLLRKSVYAWRNGSYVLREQESNTYTLYKDSANLTEIGFYVAPTTRSYRSLTDIQIREVLERLSDFNYFETRLLRGQLHRNSTTFTRYFDDGTHQTVTTTYTYNDTPHDGIPLPGATPLEGFSQPGLTAASNHLLQSVRTTCGSRSLNRYFCYTSNYYSQPYCAMADSGYIALPVMERIVADGTDEMLVTNTYSTFQRPENIQLSRRTLTCNGTEISVQDITGYDQWGNPLSVTTGHGMPVSYLWGYSHSLLIAALQGGSQGAPLTADTVLAVQYQHQPLIGCTRITQPDGLYRQYGYSGSRLSSVTTLSGQPAATYAFSLLGGSGVNMTGQTIYTSAGQGGGQTTKVFYDGLGQPVNSVQKGVTPGHQDLVTLTVYDALGRRTEEFLPSPMSPVSSIVSRDGLLTAASSFYGDSRPWQSYEYDESATEEQTATRPSGTAFYSHPVLREFHGSSATAGQYRCRRFKPSGDYALTADGWYGNGELAVEKVTDSDGRTVLVFTDFRGTKVLERRISGSDYADTYYVHDALGDLRFVLPPALCGMDVVSGNSWDIRTSSELRQYAYFYRYDARRDCVEKKLPGADPVCYLYDVTHTPVFSQDGNQRSSGQWTFTLNDRFGRPSLSGTCTSPDATEIAGRWVHTGMPDYPGYASTLCQTGYTANVTLSDAQLLTATYYDTYGFLSLPAFSALTVNAPSRSCKGLQTGTLTAVLPTGTPLCSALLYDTDDRVSQTVQTNICGGVDMESVTYTLDGRPLTRTVSRVGGSSYDVTKLANTGADLETYSYTYDHAGRLLTTTHQLNGKAARTLLSNSYDEAGRLTGTTQGGAVSTTRGYNLHGWLTSIESTPFREYLYYEQPHNGSTAQYGGNISSMDWKTGDNILRGYTFQYDGLSRLTGAAYSENGSASTHYGTSYQYDLMGNITGLTRSGLQDDNSYGLIDNLSFDYNGNQLLKVTDAVTSGPNYSGAFHFNDHSDVSQEYEYDLNGNMTKDLNKEITSVEYNVLNLPARVVANSGSFICKYASDGRKLSTALIINTLPGNVGGQVVLPIDTIHSPIGQGFVIDSVIPHPRPPKEPLFLGYQYCGSIIYNYSALSMVLIDGGYVTFNGSTPVYHYYLQDHLGNNRVVVNESGTVEQVNHYYPYGGLMGESTGGDIQKYKYNGKRLERNHGLDWYDYGARHYDAAIVSWPTMDPLSEKYYSISPYAYCVDNPVNTIDFYGLYPIWNGVMGKGARYFDSVTNEELSWGQVSNYIHYGNYEGSERLEYSDSESSRTITPWGLGVEWLTGMGERERTFGCNDFFTKLLKNHDALTKMKDNIADYIARGKRGSYEDDVKKMKYDLSGFQGVGKYINDYSTLITGGRTGNLAVTYLGSYDLNWSVLGFKDDKAVVLMEVSNTSTLQSGTRPPVIGYTETWKNTVGTWLNNSVKSGPLSMTSQKIVWVDFIKYK